jgi:hypothetical protein
MPRWKVAAVVAVVAFGFYVFVSGCVNDLAAMGAEPVTTVPDEPRDTEADKQDRAREAAREQPDRARPRPTGVPRIVLRRPNRHDWMLP